MTKLGAYGDRDRICLGTAVENAQHLEDAIAKGREIAISSRVRDALPKAVQSLFTARGAAYVAKDLTLGKLDKALKATESYASVNVIKSESGSGVAAGSGGSVVSTKPWRRS